MKKKMNNKGFSLVELIVVMAIMAILAVTLAPRLTQYVEKSRKAADKEVINSIYTAVEYALLDESLETASLKDTNSDGTTDLNLAAGLSLNATAGASAAQIDAVTEVYEVSNKTWKVNTTTTLNSEAEDSTTPYQYHDNSFLQEIYNVVGNFKLKSDDANESTNITIQVTSAGAITVSLKYDGTSTDYSVTSTEVR